MHLKILNLYEDFPLLLGSPGNVFFILCDFCKRLSFILFIYFVYARCLDFGPSYDILNLADVFIAKSIPQSVASDAS